MTTHCPKCGRPVDREDNFCRDCGASLRGASAPPAFVRPGVSPEYAASMWKNFFGPFFRVAFVFFACFFGMAILMMVFWFFTFRK
ncbi:MAG: zinc ribbon domain-containing protein [Syntrophobacteraceae bacterium]